MSYKSFADFIEILKANNELITIDKFVNPELQIAEITDRVSKSKTQNKALLFTNNGSKFPLLINSLGSEKRISLALGLKNLDSFSELLDKYAGLLKKKPASFLDKMKILPQLNELGALMPKEIKGKGKCQEVVINNPDLSIFPILKCWAHDGGKFITFPLVHTQSLKSEKRNVGMYRMQVIDNQTTAMHWHMHKTGANHYNEYKEAGIKKMPVTVVLGGDPAYTYCATAPLPENIDEYILAGLLRGKGVELVKCITNDLFVPNDADIVLEGYVDTSEELFFEGPFGDHTGYYSLEDYYPKFHITCITHRKDAVYPTTIVGIPPQEDEWIAKATERIFLLPLKMTMLPEIVEMNLPPAGVAHNLTLISINKKFPGHAEKIANSLWGTGQMMFNKVIAIFDKEVDLTNYISLIELVIDSITKPEQLYFGKGPLDILDHSSAQFAYGSKLCIDVTSSSKSQEPSSKIQIPNSKFQEPITNNQEPITNNQEPITNNQELKTNNQELKIDIKEVTGIHDYFISRNKPLLIVNIKKNRTKRIHEIIENLQTNELINNIRFILLIDEGFANNDLYSILWYSLGNLEPLRDITILKTENAELKHVFIDATRKLPTVDNFKREWPNVVISDNKTIKEIDELWSQLPFNEFIPSPSLKYAGLNTNDGAKFKA
ncbi:MAG: menaquinone biosynthesis decarboxylase [Bacteroidetes bacterium GWA2_31_9]|nr:MAG: menaquinone biosynthesis decarboxylase [Bacteroidetes bacterium GWA2_31_9]